MTIAHLELTIEGQNSTPGGSLRPADRWRSLVIIGEPTETNCALAAAFAEYGQRVWLARAASPPRLGRSDLALARVDVLPTLDGIEPGLWRLPQLERQGARLLNSPLALFAAHDKLTTALLLGRAGVAQPRTAHVREVSVPSFPPPYVVKPRFGSWGRDVYRCRDEDELRARLERLSRRPWFRRHGALVQALVEPTGRDLRIVVAAGRIVGAIERRARPGEWRTNVALGALRARVSAPPATRALALRAVAALGLDLAGVDVASDTTGRSYVLEVNGAVDFNATYADDVFATATEALLERAAVRSDTQRQRSAAAPPGTSLPPQAAEAAPRAFADSAPVGPPPAAVVRRLAGASSNTSLGAAGSTETRGGESNVTHAYTSDAA
jgi:RimK family alpha-L-glutamate ligase